MGKEWTSGTDGSAITGSVANAMTQSWNGTDIAKLWASSSTPSEAQIDRWLSREAAASGGRTESALGGDLTGENQIVGTYYNWYTAVAGSRTYTEGAGTAPMDICPAGWQLPRYEGNGSWMYLIKDTYGLISSQGDQGDTHVNNILHKFPFTLGYGGFTNVSGDVGGQGSYNYLWLNYTTSAIYARYFNFYSSRVWPINGDLQKSNGFSVRCVAKDH